jgi:hypothetical protein
VSIEEKRIILTNTNTAANNNNAIFLEDCAVSWGEFFCLSLIKILSCLFLENRLALVNKRVVAQHHYWVQYMARLTLNQTCVGFGSTQLFDNTILPTPYPKRYYPKRYYPKLVYLKYFYPRTLYLMQFLTPGCVVITLCFYFQRIV